MSQAVALGLVTWRDLTVPNAELVRDFYQAVVGWGFEARVMGGANVAGPRETGDGKLCVIRDPAWPCARCISREGLRGYARGPSTMTRTTRTHLPPMWTCPKFSRSKSFTLDRGG